MRNCATPRFEVRVYKRQPLKSHGIVKCEWLVGDLMLKPALGDSFPMLPWTPYPEAIEMIRHAVLFVQNPVRTFCLALIACTVSFTASVDAQDRSWEFAEEEYEMTLEFDDLFLFIDGNYVPPPYTFTEQDENLVVADVSFPAQSLLLESQPPNVEDFGPRRRGPGGRGQRNRKPRSQFSRLFEEIANAGKNGVVFLSHQQQPVVLMGGDAGVDFLAVKLGRELPDVGSISWKASKEVIRLADSVQANGAFIERATQVLNELEETQAKNESQIAARNLASRLNYPLTMLALILAVFAAGHLMMHAQAVFTSTPAEASNDSRMTFVNRALVVVLLMSVIDLVWTMLGHQSGTMKELNPIGGSLLSSPFSLFVFKASMTALAVGLLYSLRQLHLAQKATWWSCLVLTLLTARWLTFQSMMA